MLVVTSNWSIADGTLVRPSATWQATFPAAIHRAAARAGFRRDGAYRAIDGLDLVVAGDTFDWLVSGEWTGAVRPWHGGAAAREASLRVASGSVRSGRRLLATLSRWVRRGLRVPAVDGRGRPARGYGAVPVRVTLLAGDRDADLARVALSSTPWPIAIGDAWHGRGVTVRHGHDLDPACRVADEDRKLRSGERSPTLAESVAVDLVARFASTLRGGAPLRGIDPLIRGIAACLPIDIPVVVERWLARVASEYPAHVLATVDTAWRRSVARWLSAARGCVPTCEVEFDALSCLAGWLDRAFQPVDTSVVPVGILRLRGSRPRGHGGPADGDGPGMTVLGHAAWSPGADVAVMKTVGLGPDPAACGAEGFVPAVISRRDDTPPFRWETITAPEPANPVVTVGWSPQARDHGGTIVDAA